MRVESIGGALVLSTMFSVSAICAELRTDYCETDVS